MAPEITPIFNQLLRIVFLSPQQKKFIRQTALSESGLTVLLFFLEPKLKILPGLFFIIASLLIFSLILLYKNGQQIRKEKKELTFRFVKQKLGYFMNIPPILVTSFVMISVIWPLQILFEDPRSEIGAMGKEWSQESFLECIRVGDVEATRLFLKGDMSIEAISSNDNVIAKRLSANKTNPSEILDLLVKYGFDVNRNYDPPRRHPDIKAPALYEAIERGNEKLVKSLIDHNVDLTARISSNNGHPLDEAIGHGQPKIAFILLDAHTDITLGNYEAYRQAYCADHNTRWHKDDLPLAQELKQKVSPSGRTLSKINIELRIQVIEWDINDMYRNHYPSIWDNGYKFQAKIDSLSAVKETLNKELEKY